MLLSTAALSLLAFACDSGSGRSQAAYCLELERVKGALQLPASGNDATRFRATADAFERLEPKAPEEIRADVEKVATGFADIAEMMEKARGDVTAVDNRKLVEVSLAKKESNDRVNTYNRDRCAVDTSGGARP